MSTDTKVTTNSKNEYITKMQTMLFEDLSTKGDSSINGFLAMRNVSEQYKESVEQYVIDITLDTAIWIQKYLMHCRHMARPIDTVLVTNLINLLGNR